MAEAREDGAQGSGTLQRFSKTGNDSTVWLGLGSVLTAAMAVMGRSLEQLIPGLVILFLGSLAIFTLAGNSLAQRLHLGAPLLALVTGLIIGNVIHLPDRLSTSPRTECSIRTGTVLLSATLLLTLIFTAGPTAFLLAILVSVGALLTSCPAATRYWAATRPSELSPQVGAALGQEGRSAVPRPRSPWVAPSAQTRPHRHPDRRGLATSDQRAWIVSGCSALAVNQSQLQVQFACAST